MSRSAMTLICVVVVVGMAASLTPAALAHSPGRVVATGAIVSLPGGEADPGPLVDPGPPADPGPPVDPGPPADPGPPFEPGRTTFAIDVEQAAEGPGRTVPPPTGSISILDPARGVDFASSWVGGAGTGQWAYVDAEPSPWDGWLTVPLVTGEPGTGAYVWGVGVLNGQAVGYGLSVLERTDPALADALLLSTWSQQSGSADFFLETSDTEVAVEVYPHPAVYEWAELRLSRLPVDGSLPDVIPDHEDTFDWREVYRFWAYVVIHGMLQDHYPSVNMRANYYDSMNRGFPLPTEARWQLPDGTVAVRGKFDMWLVRYVGYTSWVMRAQVSSGQPPWLTQEVVQPFTVINYW